MKPSKVTYWNACGCLLAKQNKTSISIIINSSPWFTSFVVCLVRNLYTDAIWKYFWNCSLRQRWLDIHNSHNQWNLKNLVSRSFCAAECSLLIKNSASKFTSPGKLDFSKSKILNSVHEENLEYVTLMVKLLGGRQDCAVRLQNTRFHFIRT